jgi:hypothetical protein
LRQVGRLLADPHWFPHHIDLETGELALSPATRERLAAEPFIDGRSDFSTGPPIRVKLADALATDDRSDVEPDRMIFHVGFCGSTLLATLLDRPGRVFVAREPNVLAELANAKIAGADVDLPLRLVRHLLRRPWSAGEKTVCKPSNWVNNLLPEFTREPAAIRPLFISMEPRAFLVAAFRGGRDRLAFLISLAAHLASAASGGREAWRAASAAAADPLDRAARIVLAAHHMQTRLFAVAQAEGGWGAEHRLDFSNLQADPSEAARQASRALEVDLSNAELVEAVEAKAGQHAKQRSVGYSAERRATEDQAVEHHHRARIDAALEWSRSALPR